MSSVIQPYRLPSQAAQAPQTPETVAFDPNSKPKNTNDKFQVIPEALLGSLSLPADAISPSHARRPEKGTCSWIFRHAVFRTWQRERHGLLWIRGSSGSGKSTLMKYLASQPEPTSPAPRNNNVLHVGFVFRSTGDELYRSRLGFARSILCQLIRQFPAAFDRLAQRHERVQGLLPVGLHVIWDVQELLEEISKSLSIIFKTHSIRIVVDGVDLCGEETANKILQDFQKLVEKATSISKKMNSDNGLKIVFSSRSFELKEHLPAKVIKIDEQNRFDIESFIQRKLSNADIQTQDFILYQSAGSFLVAQLLTQSFKISRDRSTWCRRQSQNILTGDPFSLLRNRFQAASQRKGQKIFLSMMKWACFSVRPLTLAEFRVVVCTSATAAFPSIQWPLQADDFAFTCTDEGFEAWISAQSGSLLEVVNYQGKKTVQPIHELVREYMISEGLELLAPGSTAKSTTPEETIAQINYSLVRFCVHYITLTTKGADWEAKAGTRDEAQLLSYAGFAWAKHAALSRAKTKDIMEFLDLLHWPEKSKLEVVLKVMDQEEDTRLAQHSQLSGPGQSACPYGKLDGITWFQLFAVCGLHEMLEVALQKASAGEVDFRDSLGRTPLYAAVCCGHPNAVRVLLENSADAGVIVDGQSLLHIAALQGKASIQKMLLAQSSELVCSINKIGQTPLFSAVLREHVSSVSLLLQNESEVNSYDGSGTPVLLRAASLGSPAVVRVLLESGASINQQDQGGFTALHTAVAKANNSVVHLLLEKGCDVHMKDKMDRTALLLSVSRANEAATGYLLEKKSDATVTDDKGRSLLLIAIEMGNFAITKLLLEAGFDVNSKDSNSRTMLMVAVAKVEKKVVNLLLEHKASITARDKKGNSVVFYATQALQRDHKLSEEQKAICTALFEQYGQTVVSWDADWKERHELFLASTKNSTEAKKPFQGIHPYIPKDIPFFSSQTKPAGDELMFGAPSQKATPQESRVPPSLQPARIQTKDLGAPSSIPSFLLPGGSANPRRFSLQGPQRPAANPQHNRSVSESTSTNTATHVSVSSMGSSSFSPYQHSVSISGPSTRNGTPELHPLQRPGSHLRGSSDPKPSSLPSSLRSSPLLKPYEGRAARNLREIDDLAMALADTTQSVQKMGTSQQSQRVSIPSALMPGSIALNKDPKRSLTLTSKASSPALLQSIKPYPGTAPLDGTSTSTASKLSTTLDLDKPPVIPPLNLGPKKVGAQGSHISAGEDWFSKFNLPPLGQSQAVSKTPEAPTRKAPEVPRALQPGRYIGVCATETPVKPPQENSGVKNAVVAGGAGAAAGLAGGSLLHSEFLSSTIVREEHKTIMHDQSLTFEGGDSNSKDLGSNGKRGSDQEVNHESKPNPADYSVSNSARLLHTKYADSEYYESDREEGDDDDTNHGHALVDYSPADYGGHWEDDDYTSHVSSSADGREGARDPNHYYRFEFEHYQGPLNEDGDGSDHGSNSTEKDHAGHEDAQYSYASERYGTGKQAENQSGGYEGAQYSYNNKSYEARYQADEKGGNVPGGDYTERNHNGIKHGQW